MAKPTTTAAPAADPFANLKPAVVEVPTETRGSKYEQGPLAEALRSIPDGKAIALSFPLDVWQAQQRKTDSGNIMDMITNAIRQTAIAVRPSKTLRIRRDVSQRDKNVTYTLHWTSKITRKSTTES